MKRKKQIEDFERELEEISNMQSKIFRDIQSKPKAAIKRSSPEYLIDKLYECAEKKIKDIRRITREDFEEYWGIKLREVEEEDLSSSYRIRNSRNCTEISTGRCYRNDDGEVTRSIMMGGRTIKTLIKEHGIEKEAELFVKYYTYRIRLNEGEYVQSLEKDHAEERRKAAERDYTTGCSRCGHRPSDED